MLEWGSASHPLQPGAQGERLVIFDWDAHTRSLNTIAAYPMRPPSIANGDTYRAFLKQQPVDLANLCAFTYSWATLPAPPQIEPAQWHGVTWANMGEFVRAQVQQVGVVGGICRQWWLRDFVVVSGERKGARQCLARGPTAYKCRGWPMEAAQETAHGLCWRVRRICCTQ